MKTTAITGATGFVGKRLLQLNRGRYTIVPLTLRNNTITDIDLSRIDSIIHLAGKAHQMTPIDDSVYFEVNYALTKKLADHAKLNGVRQFIYVSSIKVYGDDVHSTLNELSPCLPTDAYGASKLKAEQYLQSVESPEFKIAVVRPPLVYGPEVKGNMIKLLQLAGKNFPLPFGHTNNQRSMVFVDNLIELINTIADQEASGVFIAGDKKPLATNELISMMQQNLGNKKRLISIPPAIRRIIQKLRPGLYTRLFGSFVVDNSNTNAKLHFQPPYSTEDGVAQMVSWYKTKF